MNKDIDLSPVKVEVNIEGFQLQSDAFYTVCFITENNIAPRTLEVTQLSQLVDSGYMRVSEAYNFVYGVFSQRKMSKVIIRSKRDYETFEDAYNSDDNSNFYFVVLDTKNIDEILEFNNHISNDNFKLQFFSSTEDVSEKIQGRRNLVYYFQDSFSNLTLPYSEGKGVWLWDTLNELSWDDKRFVQFEPYDMTSNLAQDRLLNFPEGSWIGYCGYYFPSRVQWLHKFLAKVSTTSRKNIPELSSTSALVFGRDKATIGSGTTADGTKIEYRIMTDWLIWAIQKNLWNILYSHEKVPQTTAGTIIMQNGLKQVLDVAVSENHFNEYKITEILQDRRNNKISMKFSATLVHTILGVDKVEGTIYN